MVDDDTTDSTSKAMRKGFVCTDRPTSGHVPMQYRTLRRRRRCSVKRPMVHYAISLLLLMLFTPLPTSDANIPEATTTALKMHRLYTIQPAHDTSLYDTLQVLPNATLAQIKSAYRRKSRDLHPDKIRLRMLQRELRRGRRQEQQRDNNDSYTADDKFSDDDDIIEEEECERELARLREAYEVLKDDQTRLPYHRFGLVDTDMAATLLTGGSIGGAGSTSARDSGQQLTAKQERLLHLMGYDMHAQRYGHHPYHPYHSSISRHERRVRILAASIIETIRPLVEGSIGQQDLAQYIASECNELKSSPLGAQILRCIGRAYRHSGQRVLRQHRRREAGTPKPVRSGLLLSDKVTAVLRDAKNVLDAAFTSGKLVLTEQKTKLGGGSCEKDKAAPAAGLERTVREALPALDYHLGAFGEPPGGDECGMAEDHPFSKDDLKEQEQARAQAAVIGALQVEALWKIAKIELDRTIQEACDRILDGRDYFFFPSYHSIYSSWNNDQYGPNNQDKDQGWVGASGEVVETEVGKLRAAAALILVGDTMVRCSKENTAWMD